jgi:hypothetical protein
MTASFASIGFSVVVDVSSVVESTFNSVIVVVGIVLVLQSPNRFNSASLNE